MTLTMTWLLVPDILNILEGDVLPEISCTSLEFTQNRIKISGKELTLDSPCKESRMVELCQAVRKATVTQISTLYK